MRRLTLIINEAFNRSAMVLLRTLSAGLFSVMFPKPDQGRIQDLVDMDRLCFCFRDYRRVAIADYQGLGGIGGARKILSFGG